eukprot:4088186-Pyramimonas_sp.AAC.1
MISIAERHMRQLIFDWCRLPCMPGAALTSHQDPERFEATRRRGGPCRRTCANSNGHIDDARAGGDGEMEGRRGRRRSRGKGREHQKEQN